MRCWRLDIRRALAAYVHDELPAHKRKQVEDHVLDCGDCRTRLLGIKTGHKLAGQLSAAVPDADPWPSIEAALDRELRTDSPKPLLPPEHSPSFRDRIMRPAPAAVILCFAIVVVAAVIGIMRARGGQSIDLSEFHPVSVQEMAYTTTPHVVAEGYVSEVGFNDEDGDLSFRLVDDLRQRDQFIVCEIIDPIKLDAPAVGSRVRVYGVSRYDGQENHNWYEVHPVLNIEVVQR